MIRNDVDVATVLPRNAVNLIVVSARGGGASRGSCHRRPDVRLFPPRLPRGGKSRTRFWREGGNWPSGARVLPCQKGGPPAPALDTPARRPFRSRVRRCR